MRGRWMTTAGTAAAMGLVAASLAGCSGKDPAKSSQPSARPTSAAPSPSAAPAVVDQDGWRRLNVLPKPVAVVDFLDSSDQTARQARVEVLRVERSGDAVRVLTAWLVPSTGREAGRHILRAARLTGANPDEVGWRMLDLEAGTAAVPLRTSDGQCVCSSKTGAIVGSNQQVLFWADFPAPAGSKVSLLLGPAMEPVQDVPVSQGEPPLELPADLVSWVGSPPPQTIGQGAASVEPTLVQRSVQTFGGAEDQQVGQNAKVSLPSDVLFAVDSASLTPAARKIVSQVASRLGKAAAGQRVQVVGHTDDQGSDDHNDRLSLARAKAVTAALAPAVRAAGVTLVPSGRGEREPVAANLDARGRPIAANRQRNRRVSFVFTRTKGGATVKLDLPRGLPAMPVARTTEPSAAVQGAVASVLSQDGASQMDVTKVERVGDLLWVRAAFTATAGRTHWGGEDAVLGQNPYDHNGTMANVGVVDASARTLALPLTYGAKSLCVCTENIGSGFLYQQPMVLWGVFPAPAAPTDKVTLRVPGVGQVVDVPVTTGPSSTSDPSTTAGPDSGSGPSPGATS